MVYDTLATIDNRCVTDTHYITDGLLYTGSNNHCLTDSSLA